MSTALAVTSRSTALARSAQAWHVTQPHRPCSPELVLTWIRKVAGTCYQDSEIATAISDAAVASPIWDDQAGALRTAALLVALALTTSNMHPNLVSPDGGFGVFQIRVPGPHVDASVLLLPRSAAHVAIELLRQSLEMPGDMPLAERLVWYPDRPAPRETWCAPERILIAHQLLETG